MSNKEVALIIGAGRGLGAALAHRFGAAGMAVAVSARNAENLETIARTRNASAYVCDAAEEKSVDALFQKLGADLGIPRLVVYNASAFMPGGILEISPTDFERAWRNTCLGGFHVGQRAAKAMLEGGNGGTILFTGATASLRGSARFANLAVGKFGLRALAHTMARELGPRGIHVGHVIIDGRIGGEEPSDQDEAETKDAQLAPEAIADTYYRLYRQPKTGWSLELDLRPWVERF